LFKGDSNFYPEGELFLGDFGLWVKVISGLFDFEIDLYGD